MNSKNKTIIINKIKKRIGKITAQNNFFKKGSPSLHVGNDIGILLIPGFDNTAYIMSEYADFFKKKGYTIYNITLPERGRGHEEFAKSSWEDLTDYILEDFLLLKGLVEKVFVAGYSSGATMTLYLASIRKKTMNPDGIILLSPAIFFIHHLIPLSFEIFLAKIFYKINPYPKKLKNRHLIFHDPLAKEKYDLWKRSSTKAIIELLNMVKNVKNNIKHLRVPVLIIQSKKDAVVDPFGAGWILKKSSSNIKKIKYLHGSGHPIMVDLEKNKVFKESLDFIKDLTEN